MDVLMTHFVDDSLALECNVPKVESHIPRETHVHIPSHPRDVLCISVDTESQPGKRYTPRARQVIQISPLSHSLPRCPRGIVNGWSRKPDQRSVLERGQKVLSGFKHLVVIDDFEDLPKRWVCTAQIDILEEVERVEVRAGDVTPPA